jgi:hypothetical protein
MAVAAGLKHRLQVEFNRTDAVCDSGASSTRATAGDQQTNRRSIRDGDSPGRAPYGKCVEIDIGQTRNFIDLETLCLIQTVGDLQKRILIIRAKPLQESSIHVGLTSLCPFEGHYISQVWLTETPPTIETGTTVSDLPT